MRAVRRRLGAKIVLVAAAGLAAAAITLTVTAVQFADSIVDDTTREARQALLAQSQSHLQRLTVEQGRHYEQVLATIEARSRVLSRAASRALARPPPHGAVSDPTMTWVGEKGFHTNPADATISLIHWGDAQRSDVADRQLRALAPLDEALLAPVRDIDVITANWVITDDQVVAYAPNLPLIDHKARAEEAAILEQPFYQIATPKRTAPGTTRWTDRYDDPAGQGVMLTAATPIHSPDGQTFLGVAGVDIRVEDAVRGLLRQHPLGEEPHGHADGVVETTSLVVDETTRPVLIGDDCRVLLGLEATPGPTTGARMAAAPLIESGPSGLRTVLEHATAQPGTHLEGLMLDGRRYIAAVQPMPTTGWTLINLVAEAALVERVAGARDAFDQQITTNTMAVSLVGGGLVLLIAVVLTLYLRRMVATPLGELATAADAIAAGQPRVTVPVRSDDEIGRVSRRFNALSERLAETLEALEARVDERTRDAEAVRDYFHSIFEHSPAGILFIDGTRHIERANPAFAALVGQDVAGIIGRSPIAFYRDPEEARIIGREAYPVLESGGTFRSVVTLERADGSPITCSIMGRAVNPGVLDEGFIWVIQDITEQKRLERELAHLATHDHLTGTYNRLKIVEVMEQATQAAARYGEAFSVVLFDVDHFKLINDTYGHTAGDRVLKQLTASVEASLRETDHLGRWGGEEFIVVASHTPLAAAAQLAERIRVAVADTTFTDVDTVTVSLGVVAYSPGETIEQLEERADHFLYQAKQTGRNRVVTQNDDG